MTAEERTTYESGRTEEVAALESSLAAAWLKDHAPADGVAGSSCSTTKCTTSAQCCGISTPKTGRYVTETLEDICADSSTLVYTDALGREYDHVCGAQRMLVAAAAAVAALAALV